MFSLLKNIIKFTLYLAVFLILLVTLVPYFFSLKNPFITSQLKPYNNSKYIIENDYFMHYRYFKSEHAKRKILLIHGLGGSTYSFRKNVDSLVNAGFSVLAIDVPPFGYSVKNKDLDYTDTIITRLIYTAILKIDSLENTKNNWVVVGHSLGVNILAKLVTLHPSNFVKQVFIDGYYMGDIHDGWSKIGTYPPLLKLSDVALEKYYYDEDEFSKLLEKSSLVKPTDDEINFYMAPFNFKYSLSSILKLTATKSEVQINKSLVFGKPTLVIWGKEDPLVPFRDDDFNLKSFNDVSFKMIDSCGHVPMETHPDIVNKFLITFIKD